MSISSYEGPRDGDYVRYVDALLRSSALHHTSDQAGRSDFSTGNAQQTPGGQPASAWERLRQHAQAAVEQAQRELEQSKQAAQPAGQRARQAQESEQSSRREKYKRSDPKKSVQPNKAQGGKKPWYQITLGRVLFVMLLGFLAIKFPSLGTFVLLAAIINGVRSSMQSIKDKA